MEEEPARQGVGGAGGSEGASAGEGCVCACVCVCTCVCVRAHTQVSLQVCVFSARIQCKPIREADELVLFLSHDSRLFPRVVIRGVSGIRTDPCLPGPPRQGGATRG